MSFYVGKGLSMLAEACSPSELPEGVAERYANDDTLEGMRDLWDLVERCNSFQVGGSGDAKFVGQIPAPALLAALHFEPDLLLDKKKFWRWYKATEYYKAQRRG